MLRKRSARTASPATENLPIEVKDETGKPEMRFESEKHFNEWRMQTGFSAGFRGTYRHDSGRGYLYVKHAHRVETNAQANESLALLRDITRKGALHPNTVWGSYPDEQGESQLFALTPTLTQDLGGVQQPKSFLSPDYKGLFEEGSYVVDWYRRVDPTFDPKVGPAENSPAWLLNPWEAAHGDNWAWDETGTLYPVDVEVINISGPKNATIVHNWYMSQQANG